jgi:vitamin B12 transporter
LSHQHPLPIGREGDKSWESQKTCQLALKTDHRSGRSEAGNMLKYFISYIAIALPLCLLAHHNDSLIEGKLMAQLTIVAKSEVGPLKFKSDSLLFKRNSHQSLGGFLEKMGWANVTSYGAPGGLITARINGSSSDHAVVFWNAMPLTNPALGLTDLSLVPMALFDGANIKGNQNLIGKGQGGLGGTISLENVPEWEKSVELNTGLNSLKNSFAHIVANYNVFGIQMRTIVLKESNRNEFEYIDQMQIRRPMIAQHHNNNSNSAIMQTMHWRGRKGLYAQAQGWYQVRTNRVPELMGSNQIGTAEQRDSLWRGSITVGYHIPSQNEFLASAPVEVIAAHNREYLRYTDRAFPDSDVLSIDSRLRTDVSMQSVNWKPRTSTGMHRFHIDARNFAVGIENTNYAGGRRKESFQSLHVSYALHLEQYHSRFSLFGYQERRNEFDTKPSYGSEFYFQGNDIKFYIPNIRIAFAHRFRVPDFNERFWVPGGNPSLSPERGNHESVELSWAIVRNKNIEWNLLADAGAQQVLNWIQWIPLPDWSPVNYKNVDIRYLGLMTEVFCKIEHHQIGLRANWKLTESIGRNDQSEDSFQMIYTPRNTVFGQIEYQYKGLEVGVDGRFIDVRFTNEENNERTALDAYYLINAYLGFSLKGESCSHSILLTCDNANNIAFQSVRSYAMPRRFFGIQYRIKLEVKSKSKSK